MNIKTDKISIFWGQKGSSNLYIRDRDSSAEQLRAKADTEVKLAYQTHSNHGFAVEASFEAFSKEGDFLLTNQKNLKIGVKTADCVPIVFHDPKTDCVGVAHAGWKGTINKVASKVIKAMSKEFKSKSEDVLVWIGPSAKSCCYEVSENFLSKLDPDMERRTTTRFSRSIFLNLPTYNEIILVESGVKRENISKDYNKCTICNIEFGSYRREGENSPLQISYVMLD